MPDSQRERRAGVGAEINEIKRRILLGFAAKAGFLLQPQHSHPKNVSQVLHRPLRPDFLPA